MYCLRQSAKENLNFFFLYPHSIGVNRSNRLYLFDLTFDLPLSLINLQIFQQHTLVDSILSWKETDRRLGLFSSHSNRRVSRIGMPERGLRWTTFQVEMTRNRCC